MTQHTLYFDGASRGNPGDASFGAVVYDNLNNEVTTTNGCIGKATNNVAEYYAILNGLKVCQEIDAVDLKVYGDSSLVINQLNGEWKVRNPALKLLYTMIKDMESSFSSISYEHVRRDKNKRADQLANVALDKNM